MNRQRVFVRKISYLVAIVVLLLLLIWLGQPATSDVGDKKGSPGGLLAQMRSDNGLSEAKLGEIDPASETIKLATLGMRGVATVMLWEKADDYKKRKDWTNLAATLNQMILLEPHFIAVWRHQGWNLSYNVSAEFDDYRERYRWVIKGIEFLKRGIHYNRSEPKLPWDVGWFISQKIGRSDEHKQFRRLFKLDDDFNAALAPEERDNWLVGKRWFLDAEDVVAHGGDLKKTTQVLFYSNPPMCQMNYAEALEKEDGTFDEKALLAWQKADREWSEYGAKPIGTSDPGVTIQLNDKERFEAESAALVAQLEKLAPGLREKIRKERYEALDRDQRTAIDTPSGKRTSKQWELIGAANERMTVRHEDVARRVTLADRSKAMDLAKKATELDKEASNIDRYRQIVNFEYWRRRAKIEQTDEALAARKAIDEGNRALAVADLGKAKQMYEKGLVQWRLLLDKKNEKGELAFPGLIPDESMGTDLMEIIQQYRKILEKRDEKMPEPFILQDIIDIHEKHIRKS
jgi:hypothetical protein